MTRGIRSPRAPGSVFAELEDLLACPGCQGALELRASVIRCAACGGEYPQLRDDCVSMLSREQQDGIDPDWAARQREMEAWYRDMVGSDWSRACLAGDYGPFAPVLARYAGTVLDLGGGAGVTRHYLGAGPRYVVVDPSVMWLGAEWAALADEFPCLAEPPAFVQGTGESLPFRRGAFDVVLAFWTLNHAADPARMLRGAARVLKPGGVFLAVLEDMKPTWQDVVRPEMRRRGPIAVARLAACRAAASLPGRDWPLQSDHVRIREDSLLAWSAADFDVRSRAWIGGYLTYELIARPIT